MLSRENRLTKKRDFERVFKEGKTQKQGSIYLKFTPNALQYSRFGFVVGRKFSHKATIRNYLKRRLREAVKQSEGIKNGFDVVIVANQSGIKRDWESVQVAVKTLLTKTGLINLNQNDRKSF